MDLSKWNAHTEKQMVRDYAAEVGKALKAQVKGMNEQTAKQVVRDRIFECARASRIIQFNYQLFCNWVEIVVSD